MANKKEGFTEVHNRRKFPLNQNKNWKQKVYNGNGNRQEYKKKNVTNGGPQVASTSKPQGDKGKENQVDKMNRGTNQFDVLKEINASEEVELGALKGKPLVDVYLRKKLQPTCAESSNWSMVMIKYFKDQWELDRLKDPVVVNFPQTFVKKKKAFRFANFITMRDTFLPTVAAGWEVKGLKYSLKSISWKNGNMAEYVDKCRNDLKIAQGNLDREPHNQDLKKKNVDALDKYNKATKEEESFLFQKAKVDWISKCDRNNQYFHKIIKSRRQVNKIVSICDNYGNRLEGNLIEEQFVNHFKKFLGANKVTDE
ncbi:hypothetical protein Tco_0996548, partial [Tanacetum coccineum]